MATQIRLGEVVLDVIKKDIKNVHLSVYPPSGRVRVSAPLRMKTDTIRVFAISKLAWIKQQQRKLRAQERETPREWVNGESHYLWGKRYLLIVAEVGGGQAGIELRHSKIMLRIHPGAAMEKRAALLDEWYRQQLHQTAVALIAKWQVRFGVTMNRLFIQRMKTKWGSCNTRTGNIRLNTELAKKPKACLEYIVVHELAHLIEPTHNDRFVALMDRHMPQWRDLRDQLNRLPVRHETWAY